MTTKLRHPAAPDGRVPSRVTLQAPTTGGRVDADVDNEGVVEVPDEYVEPLLEAGYERVEDDSDGQGEDDGNSNGDEGDSHGFNLADSNNSEVEEYVAEVDDVDVLEDLLEDEEAGEDRKGAKSAIESRLEELREDDEEA